MLRPGDCKVAIVDVTNKVNVTMSECFAAKDVGARVIAKGVVTNKVIATKRVRIEAKEDGA